MMKTFCTEIQAINPRDGKLTSWSGPRVQALSWGLAEEYLQIQGLGYARIIGEYIQEQPFQEEKKENYETQNHQYN